MIISHKHKFIFIKTAKTAGTSFEIALSKLCGPDDVITPLIQEDEERRVALGYPSSQNYHVPIRSCSFADVTRSVLSRNRIQFGEHDGQKRIRRYIAPTIWDTYYKFCFERNPYDKVVSFYYWRYRDGKRTGKTLSEFIQSGEASRIAGFELYSEHSEIVVDRVFRFEDLDQAIVEVKDKLNLSEVPEIPRTKTSSRKSKKSYREELTEADRKKIECVFAREIKYFDYQW